MSTVLQPGSCGTDVISGAFAESLEKVKYTNLNKLQQSQIISNQQIVNNQKATCESKELISHHQNGRCNGIKSLS